MKLTSDIIKKLIKEEYDAVMDENEMLDESASLMVAMPVVMLAASAAAFFARKGKAQEGASAAKQIVSQGGKNFAKAREAAMSIDPAIMGYHAKAQKAEKEPAEQPIAPSSQPPDPRDPDQRPEVAR